MITLGIIEVEYQAIVFSSIGLTVCIGLTIYLLQGVFLFLFQVGSTPSVYYIKQNDVVQFLIVVLIGTLVFEIPNVIKITSFIKTYRKFIF